MQVLWIKIDRYWPYIDPFPEDSYNQFLIELVQGKIGTGKPPVKFPSNHGALPNWSLLAVPFPTAIQPVMELSSWNSPVVCAGWGPQFVRRSWFVTMISIVYDTQINISKRGYKPTYNQGAHPVEYLQICIGLFWLWVISHFLSGMHIQDCH